MLCYSVIRSTDLQYMVQRVRRHPFRFECCRCSNRGFCEFKWVPQFSQHAPGVPILLVGMKEDLRNDPKYQTRVVTIEAGSLILGAGITIKPHSFSSFHFDLLAEKMAKELGAVAHMTCSSLTGDGVQVRRKSQLVSY
jgi:GTPase SAR1 family protein